MTVVRSAFRAGFRAAISTSICAALRTTTLCAGICTAISTTTLYAAFATLCTTLRAAFTAATATCGGGAASAISATTFCAFATSICAAIAAYLHFALIFFDFGCGRCCRQISAAKQSFEPAKKSFFCGRSCRRCCCWCGARRDFWSCGLGHFRLGLGHGRRCIGQHAFDDGLLLVVLFLAAACHGRRVFNFFSQLVAGFNVVQTRIIVLQALKTVIRRFKRFIWHQQNVDALLHLDLADFRAFLIQQERRHINRHLAKY